MLENVGISLIHYSYFNLESYFYYFKPSTLTGTQRYILCDKLESTFLTEIPESREQTKSIYEGSKLRLISYCLVAGNIYDAINSLSSYSSLIISRMKYIFMSTKWPLLPQCK